MLIIYHKTDGVFYRTSVVSGLPAFKGGVSTEIVTDDCICVEHKEAISSLENNGDCFVANGGYLGEGIENTFVPREGCSAILSTAMSILELEKTSDKTITPYNILDVEMFSTSGEFESYTARIKVKTDDPKFTFKYITLTAGDSKANALSLLRQKLSELFTWDNSLITSFNYALFDKTTGSLHSNVLQKLKRTEALSSSTLFKDTMAPKFAGNEADEGSLPLPPRSPR